KELLTERSGPVPRIKELPTEAEEAAWVAAEIRAAVESGARRCRDFAILVRSNKNAEPFLRALDEQGVPYYFSGSRGLFQRPEIKALNIVKFFKVIQSYGSVAVVDRVALFLRHLGAIMEYGEDPAVAEIGEESDVVQVLTIHRAKGLEFPVVYLVQAATDRFPTR